MLQLQNVAQSEQFSSSAWIGLYNDINSWRWSFENTSLGPMTKWNSKQPDNHNGNEECAITNKGIWSDMPCVEPNPFICFDDEKIGTDRYIYISDKMTWHAAQSYCRQQYTDLASVRDVEEAGIIQSTIDSGNFWFGLFRDSWKWTDQTNASSIKWKDGQPDNKDQNENCGYLLKDQAEDEVCSVKKFFFCHSVITGQKQLIRVKVGSTQDVNDPEVKAAILEKIKEKLKEHGMTDNTMVMWRKQPDGEVFYKEKEKNVTVENNTQDTGEL
ncbi:macrophage mannose receptor 1-like [Pangasianodon hypophthalmus]|uniref:macrophage mannose receptor 1-like n=1 Tax=Pangasianodon hypophthalmus TaxID=310915 RepID=UPI0023081673|nr:macrophage mannose receptor 1-like [Pangasianodon hypophthalmus]